MKRKTLVEITAALVKTIDNTGINDDSPKGVETIALIKKADFEKWTERECAETLIKNLHDKVCKAEDFVQLSILIDGTRSYVVLGPPLDYLKKVSLDLNVFSANSAWERDGAYSLENGPTFSLYESIIRN